MKSEREGSFVGDTDSCIPKYMMPRPRRRLYIYILRTYIGNIAMNFSIDLSAKRPGNRVS